MSTGDFKKDNIGMVNQGSSGVEGGTADDSNVEVKNDETRNVHKSLSQPSTSSLAGAFKIPILPIDVKSKISSSTINCKTNSNIVEPLVKKSSKVEDGLVYYAPLWSSTPSSSVTYRLSEIKNGVIIKEINLNKSFYIIGRLKSNDIVLSHESVSRHHAVLQYGSPTGKPEQSGYFMYDLGSANGTIINKQLIKGRIYTPIKGGHVFKIAFSTRIFTLDVINSECSEDSEDDNDERTDISEEGINWGQGEDASEATDPCPEFNYFSSCSEFHDPVRVLKGWFSDECLTPDFKLIIDPINDSVWLCSVQLPLKESLGGYENESDYIAHGKGRSKDDAIRSAAVDACQELVKCGFPISRYDKQMQKSLAKDDYYTSDEDPFFDQTGELEKKREQRKKRTMRGKRENSKKSEFDKSVSIHHIKELEKQQKKHEASTANKNRLKRLKN